MELQKEFIETHKLSEDQVKAVTEYGKTLIATEKGKVEDEWREKAHKDAQGILAGAAESVEKLTGIKRKESEKVADFIGRSANEFTAAQKAELDKLKTDYEEKIKGVKDAGTLKDEYEKMKAEKDELLKKYADFDTLKEKAEKADQYGQELTGLKRDMAFTKVKPAFPDTVNPFEAKAKWEAFEKSILDKNTIELVDGEYMAIDKENPYKTTKLSDLVAKDETLQALLKGRQQTGLGGKEVEKKKVDGVPFEVPANGSNQEISDAIRTYLVGKGHKVTTTAYSQEFEKYIKLIKGQQTA